MLRLDAFGASQQWVGARSEHATHEWTSVIDATAGRRQEWTHPGDGVLKGHRSENLDPGSGHRRGSDNLFELRIRPRHRSAALAATNFAGRRLRDFPVE